MKGKKPRKAQRLYSSLCFSAEHFCVLLDGEFIKEIYEGEAPMKILTIIEIIFQNQILMFIKAACQRSLSRKFYAVFLLYVND